MPNPFELLDIAQENLPSQLRMDQSLASIGNIHALGDPDQYLQLPCNSSGWRPVYHSIQPSSAAAGGVALAAGISWLDTWEDSGHPAIGDFTDPNKLKLSDGTVITPSGSSGWIKVDVGARSPGQYDGTNWRGEGAAQAINNDPIAMALLSSLTSGNYSSPEAKSFSVLEQDDPQYYALSPSLQYVRGSTSPYNVHRIIYWVKYGKRSFIGFAKCKGDHVHGSADVGILEGSDDNDILFPLTTSVYSSSGGFNPELIFYGGDVDGIDGYANVTSAGTIQGIYITDPGAGVVDVERSSDSFVPPDVILSTPSDFGLFEGFTANVNITDNPQRIQNLYSELNLAIDAESAQENFCQGLGYADPLAQTFLVSGARTSGEGIFISSIDVVFQNKPSENNATQEDVILELRPVTEGDTPARDLVLDMAGRDASVRKRWDEIVNIATGVGSPTWNPPVFGTEHTSFVFDSPIYLEPDTAYAFVLRSNDSAYRVWITDTRENQIVEGELQGESSEGSQIASSDGQARRQYGGALFKSQNGRSWIESPEQDMMFRINRCNFTSSTGNFNVYGGNNLTTARSVDRMMLKTNPGTGSLIPKPGETRIGYGFTHYDESATAAAILPEFVSDTTVTLPSRGQLRASQHDGDFVVNVTLNNDSNKISPVIDVSQWQADILKNKINNGGLANSQINFPGIADSTGYTNGDTLNVTGGGGTGGVITVTVDTGTTIAGAYVSSSGSGYYKTASVESGSGITLTGEESAHGGNAKFKYITKPVTLAPGMDATDIKVFLAVNKPNNSSVYVYYKVAAEEDGEPFDNKGWNVMRQVTPSEVSSTTGGFKEFEFDTGGDDQITYTTADGSSTFDTFKTFAIKIVGFSASFTHVPILKDFRAIAVT